MNNLTLPSPAPDFDYSALDRAKQSNKIGEATHKKYQDALARLLDEGINPWDYEALANYANSIPHSSRGQLKAALSILVKDYEMMVKSQAVRGEVGVLEVQRLLWALEAISKAIHVEKQEGHKVHIWLSQEQVKQITSLPDKSTPTGKRDWIILAVLFASGLRCSELAELAFDALKQQPMKNGQPRDVLEILHGKGDKARVVPISKALADGLREWYAYVGNGRIARRVNKAGVIGDSLTGRAIYDIVTKYGEMIGIKDFSTHNTRRTFNQLSYEAGADILQLKEVDGHASIVTTERYLNRKLNLENTPSDTIPIRG